jgi:YHS domain-containing protein
MTKLSLLCLCAALATACGGSTKEPEVASSPAAPAADAPASQPADQAAVATPGTALKIGDKTKCPVSGEAFVVAENSPKVTYEGKDYYFCCPSCAEEFKANPKKYAK